MNKYVRYAIRSFYKSSKLQIVEVSQFVGNTYKINKKLVTISGYESMCGIDVMFYVLIFLSHFEPEALMSLENIRIV